MSDEEIREAAALSIARSEELWGAQPHDDEWQDYAGGAVIDAVRPLIEARQRARASAAIGDLMLPSEGISLRGVGWNQAVRRAVRIAETASGAEDALPTTQGETAPEARQHGEIDRLRAKVDDLAFEVGTWMRRANEVEDLRRWKAEAMEVLAGWEKVYEALGSPGPLGSRKSESALIEIQRRSNPGGEHD